MCSSTTTASRPSMATPQPPVPLAQAAKVEKRKKRMSRKRSFDLRRGVLINNAFKVHHQRKQEREERRKQREAAKVAQALEAISAVKVPPSAVAQCNNTSPFLTQLQSPPMPNPIFNIHFDNSSTSLSISSSSNAKTTPICINPDLFEMELKLKHDQGDVIAKASANGIIVHACNCLGGWGSGIALQLKQHFPAAYAVYAQHCQAQKQDPAELLGTCLLIPPQVGDYDSQDEERATSQGTTSTRSSATIKESSKKNKKKEPVWIACLFTSVGYGKGNKRNNNPGVSSKADIEEATRDALLGMMWKWRDIRAEAVAEEYDSGDEKEGDDEGKAKEAEERAEKNLAMPGSEIFSPRFNAGSFGVPWEATEELILQRWGGVEVTWTVVSN